NAETENLLLLRVNLPGLQIDAQWHADPGNVHRGVEAALGVLHGWLVLLKTGACCGLPIFFEVTTNWRAGCLMWPARFGGRGDLSRRPYPYPYLRRRPSASVLLSYCFSGCTLRNKAFRRSFLERF